MSLTLPSVFSAAKPDQHLFFAIHVDESFVEAVLWAVEAGVLKTLAESHQHPWQDDESCLEAVDHSLQELGKEAEDVKESLFALSPDWVDAHGIIADRKPLFHKISKELSLEAVGFVVTVEAIIQHLTELDTAHAQMFFANFSEHFVSLSLVKNGKIIHTHQVGRSGDTASDFVEAFAHFSEKIFPAKFVLFSPTLAADEVEKAQQQLIAFDWTGKYPFLHPPVTEVYPAENLMEVIVHTGGKALAEAKKLTTTEPVIGRTSTPTLTPEPIETLHQQEHKQESAPEPEVSEHKELSDHANAILAVPSSSSRESAVPQPKRQSPAIAKQILQKVFHPNHPPILFIVLGVLAGLLILIGVAFIAADTMLTAQVRVTTKSQVVSREAVFTLDASATQSNPEALILKAEVVKKQVSGEKTSTTTGKKIIGDKAKGKATIFNRTSSSKTFATGTVLKTGTLSFVLSEPVTVASASTGTNFETKPGTAEVSIAAAQIGQDSNISKDIDMTVESFAKETYVARTSTELSGGTSREIQAVSTQDRDALLTSLKKELSDQAAAELKTEGGSGKFLVPTYRVKVITSAYSAEVGKETDNFSLKLTLEAEALSYSNDELQPVAKQLLTSQVPAGYQLTEKAPEVLSQVLSSATGSAQVKLQTSISAQATAELSAEQVQQMVIGKPVQTAKSALLSSPAVEQAEIWLVPQVLTIFHQKIPSDAKRVTVQLK